MVKQFFETIRMMPRIDISHFWAKGSPLTPKNEKKFFGTIRLVLKSNDQI